MPGEIRRQIQGEIEEVRSEMAAREAPAWRVNLRTLALLLVGFVQHVPLVGAEPELERRTPWVDRAAVAGWLAWRFSGPMLFVGFAFGIVPLVVLGALALLASFGCIAVLVAAADERFAEREARFVNAVFGGTAAVIAFVAVIGVLFGFLAAVGSLFGTSAVSGFSMRALVFFATIAFGTVSLVGWSPTEWKPTRLVRH